jgi:glycosyltransferase involved in cell wall biosynthesis
MAVEVDAPANLDARVGFVFGMGHGHYAQFHNLRDNLGPEVAGDVACIPLYGDRPGRKQRAMPRLLAQRVYSANQLWHAEQGLRQHPKLQSLVLAHVSTRYQGLIRRYRTYFYTDCPPFGELMYGHPSEGMALRKLKHALAGRLFRSAAGVIAMSEWAAAGIREYYRLPESLVKVVPPGANLEKWPYVDRAGRDASAPARILMVGGEFRRKGGDLMLSWAERTPTSGWELDIVTWPWELPDWVKALFGDELGEGPACRSLAPRLPNVRVHIGVKANTREAIALFDRADIFCLPTRADLSSIASLEAMATGLPVIVSRVGGIPELISEGETGILMEPGSVDDMDARLAQLIGDPALRLAMGRAGRRSVEERLNARRQAADLYRIASEGLD